MGVNVRMKLLRSAIKAICLSAGTLAWAGMADAGIIRDDVPDAGYLALAAQPDYDAVGLGKRINNQGTQTVADSSGVLIAPNWVLTAAHTELVRKTVAGTLGSTFEIGGELRNVTQAIRHPNYTNVPGDPAASIALGWDIALVELDAPINTVTPASLYTGNTLDLIGEELIYTGFGRSGTGDTGDTIIAGTKRAGTNKGEQLGYTINPGLPEEEVFSDQIIFADMDDPPGGLPYGNPLGGNTPLSFEYLIAEGDSGGGLFIEDNGQHYLAAVHSIFVNFDPFSTIGYGDIMGSTTIEAALPWITSTITVVPIIGDLDGDGFVGLDDIDIVLNNWNQFVTPGDLLAGDPSNDGFVGLADLDIILNNWNAGSPSSFNIAGLGVPEPATAAVLLAALPGMLRRARR